MRIHRRNNKAKAKAGLTLVEIAIAMPIIAIAMGMFVQMLTAGTNLRSTSRDNWVASMAVQDTLEIMRNDAYEDLFVLYNDNPLDDPGGPGTAQGIHFDVEGLEALASDVDGQVGRIHLPTFNAGSAVAPVWQLREDQANPALGMPRDLNGDSIINTLDHASDFTLLPVQIELQWQSRFGPRRIRMQTILTQIQ